MRGIELVRDRATKEPASDETSDILEATREMGALFGKTGLYGNVLRVKPPLCLTREDAVFALEVLGAALDRV